MERTKLFTSIENYELLNERFAKVKIRIGYAGTNRNRTSIAKEVWEKSAYSLKYAPIVGYYMKDEEMFDGHSERITIENDEFKVETLTVPYGVVIGDGDNPFWWEDVVEENGNVRSYFTCYGLLWIGRYPELASIRNGAYSQSMEIIVEGGHWDEVEDLYHITDMKYDALCILQRQIPCFESSTISLAFSKKEYEVEYKTMINELKSFTLDTLGKEEVEMREETKVDNVEVVETEATDVATEEVVEGEGVETVEEKVADEQPKDDTVEGEESKADEPVEVEVVEGEVEKEDFEAKYNETLAELNELKAKYVDLESNFTALNSEISELREYKLNIEKEAKDEKLNAIFEEYSALSSIEEYNSLFKKRYELDEEELIKSLKVIAFDNGINIKKTKKEFSKKEVVKIPVVSGVELSTDSAWSLLDRHIKK